jgi:HPt (histidine-containing phosphotransfer) domain-containing protein
MATKIICPPCGAEVSGNPQPLPASEGRPGPECAPPGSRPSGAEQYAAGRRVSLRGDEPPRRRQGDPGLRSEPPVLIDMSAVNGIRAMERGAPHLFASLVDRFLGESRDQLAVMRRSVQEEAWAELHAAAHTLKSTSALLGALRLSWLCQNLEHATRYRAACAARGLVARVEIECALACEALSAIRGEDDADV